MIVSGGEELVDGEWIHCQMALLDALRGHIDRARELLAFCEEMAVSDDSQDRAMRAASESGVALAAGNHRLALDAALRAIDEFVRGGLPLANESVRLSFPDGVDAALAMGDPGAAEGLLELFANRPPGEIPPFLHAQLHRARSLLAAARGEEEGVEEGFLAAEGSFRGLGYPYWTARSQLDRAEWLAARGRTDEAAQVATEAAAAFEAMEAAPMLTRARGVLESDALGSLEGAQIPSHQ